MSVQRRSESAKRYAFNSWRDLTPMHISLGDMLHNKTGSWRFIKPVYEDKTPACQNGCPAGNNIEAWIKLVQEGDFQGAFWQLKREQPFPAILGRVCFKFCQERCNRDELDHSVQINELERFVGDQVPVPDTHPQLPPYNGKTLAIIGSGPAGMSCAYFARLLGFEVTIFEKLDQPGGILRVGIPAYRLDRQVVADAFSELANMGIDIQTGAAVGERISTKEICDDFDYLFLATGVHTSMKMGLANEDHNDRVMSGLDFLKHVAQGQSVTLGEEVVVIGGGNTAIDAARTAVRLGARVTVVYRRSENEMPAHSAEVEEARNEGVAFIFLAAPERLELNPDESINKLICCEMQLGSPDDSGRRRPVKREGSQIDLPADTVLSAIGEKADLAYLEDALPISSNTLAVNADLAVQPGAKGINIYAGGDIIDIPHTVIHAVAAGKQAAMAMDCDRQGKDFGTVRKQITVGTGPGLSFAKYMGWQPLNGGRHDFKKVVTADAMVFDYFEKTDPEIAQRLSVEERTQVLSGYQSTYSADQARKEALRCMHCGRCTACDNCLIFCPDLSVLVDEENDFCYAFDYDYCKGCGICATECPRSAITMLNEQTPVAEEEA